MNVSHIISELSPINSKEKVDALIQKMNENHLIMNVYTKMAIRTAIQKVDVQEYFIERYDGGISEKEFEEEQKRERQAQNQLNKIKADRIKSLESHEEHPKKIVKRRKPKQKPKTKYKGSKFSIIFLSTLQLNKVSLKLLIKGLQLVLLISHKSSNIS